MLDAGTNSNEQSITEIIMGETEFAVELEMAEVAAGRRILIVDDDASLTQVLAYSFAKAGF